jgi:copper chaperone CopZ
VSFREGEARVVFDPTAVSIEKLIETINALGFRASLK